MFFLIDCLFWIIIGIFMGKKLSPYQNHSFKNGLFIALTAIISFFAGLSISVTNGIPENQFNLFSLFYSSVISFFIIWIFSANFRRKFSKEINSI